MCSVLQTFSSILRKDCELRGLGVEVFDLADVDPEERLIEEVCCVCVCMYLGVVNWRRREEESSCLTLKHNSS